MRYVLSAWTDDEGKTWEWNLKAARPFDSYGDAEILVQGENTLKTACQKVTEKLQTKQH